MRIQSVRFGEFQWNVIQHAATLESASASQYIRDAATIRAVLDLATRGEIPSTVFASMVKACPELVKILEASQMWANPPETLEDDQR